MEQQRLGERWGCAAVVTVWGAAQKEAWGEIHQRHTNRITDCEEADVRIQRRFQTIFIHILTSQGVSHWLKRELRMQREQWNKYTKKLFLEIKTCLPNIKYLSRGSRKERDYNHCWNKNEKTQEIPPEHRAKKIVMESMSEKKKT